MDPNSLAKINDFVYKRRCYFVLMEKGYSSGGHTSGKSLWKLCNSNISDLPSDWAAMVIVLVNIALKCYLKKHCFIGTKWRKSFARPCKVHFVQWAQTFVPINLYKNSYACGRWSFFPHFFSDSGLHHQLILHFILGPLVFVHLTPNEAGF